MTEMSPAERKSLSTVTDKILALVTPIVTGLKLDLYDLEWNGGILKITIDTPPNSDGGVTLDQLALVTRLVGRDFDHHDPIPGHYTLEVSSPGLERTLRTPAHFQREIGKTVNIRLRSTVNGERRLNGVLIAADDDTATIRLDDKDLSERVITLSTIDRARTVFQWEKGEKLTPSTGSPKKAAGTKAAGPKAAARGAQAGAGKNKSGKNNADKPAPGPSDELDSPIEQEATA